ncbi:MAG TPA: SIMPL domain-containing protein [Candidatus Woesebacteria bacterium]|nr:SIMPL domain-containing protein [Candidatus Woesebacteria bacterium]
MKKIIGTVVLVLILVWIVPWSRVNWGRIIWQQAEVVTVNGEARSQEKNQLANYSAGVMAQNMDKNAAITEVNTKMEDLIKSVKDFGIKEADIKTQSLSYYQEPKGGQNPGQWQVNNTIEIILRDIGRSSDLADLLAKSGANSVYGPNFMMDDTNEAEKGLYDAAIKDAKDKAESIARASGRTLGKILSVSDGAAGSNVIYPMSARDGAGGGGMSVEPGSTTVYKNLTVTFELK